MAHWRAAWWALCQEPGHLGFGPSSAVFLVCHHQQLNNFWRSQFPHLWNRKARFLKMGCISSIQSCLPALGYVLFKSRAYQKIWQKAIAWKYCWMNECSQSGTPSMAVLSTTPREGGHRSWRPWRELHPCSWATWRPAPSGQAFSDLKLPRRMWDSWKMYHPLCPSD